MRRFLTWYLPLAVALAAAATFAFGFFEFAQGKTGTRVDASPRGAVAAQPDRQSIAALILGDSVARGTGDETGLGIGGRLSADLRARKVAAKPVANFAVNGSRTRDLLQLLQSRNVRTVIAQSNVVIVSIGGNDLWGDNAELRANPMAVNPGALMAGVLENISRIVAAVREANPTARIFFVGLYNPFTSSPFGNVLGALVTQWNARLAEKFASDPNFTVVQTADLFRWRDRLSSDRFHPGGEGYELIARRIADAL